MSTLSKLSRASLWGAFVSLSACAAHPMAQDMTANDEAQIMTTVKPGAAIEMSFEAPNALEPSQYGVLVLSFTEGYDSGTMKLTVTPEPGLRFVSEVMEKEFSMAGNDPHEWELDVTATQDGIYYVNVLASVNLPDGRETGRAFAARVDVGDISKATAKKSIDKNGELSSDGTTLIMRADEIIK